MYRTYFVFLKCTIQGDPKVDVLLIAFLYLWLKFWEGVDKYWIVPVRKSFYFHHCPNLNWLLTSLCFKTLYLYFSYCCRNSSKRIFTGWCVQTMFWRNVPYSGQNMQQNLLNVSHIGLHTNTTLLESKQCNDYLKMWSEKMCLWFIETAMNLPFSCLIFTN